jgi:malonyl-CoA/methylmalonyl-CoA synthetase
LCGDELLERTEAAARKLVGAGARPGDRVIVAAVPSAAFVIAHCGALRAGLVVVPVNPAAARRELEVAIAGAQAKIAICGSEELAAWAKSADPHLVVTTPDLDLPVAGPCDLDEAEPGDPALLMYTSGTTGAPKGAELSHANLLAGAASVVAAWGWSERDRLILALPLCHVHGLGIGLHGGLLAGSAVLLFERFDPESVLGEAALGATMFFGVPTMYERLAGAAGSERLGRLRLCVSGSAPLNPATHRRIAQQCGQVVLERYGMTETLLLVSNPLNGERRAGSVGFPLPGVDLRLDEATGEILVRGPSVFSGYRDLPEVNATAFADGWFRTGDIGAIDDGYLRIVGRAKELIITGGFNVYPREVEDVLRSFPGVIDAAVVGTPSEEWGETVTAFVEGPERLDLDALGAHAAAELASYKRPRLLYRLDALPRNLLGKVVKERLTAVAEDA